MPRLVVFLFDDLILPFDASGPLMGHDLIPSHAYLSDVLLLFFYTNYKTRGLTMEAWEEYQRW